PGGNDVRGQRARKFLLLLRRRRGETDENRGQTDYPCSTHGMSPMTRARGRGHRRITRPLTKARTAFAEQELDCASASLIFCCASLIPVRKPNFPVRKANSIEHGKETLRTTNPSIGGRNSPVKHIPAPPGPVAGAGELLNYADRRRSA